MDLLKRKGNARGGKEKLEKVISRRLISSSVEAL